MLTVLTNDKYITFTSYTSGVHTLVSKPCSIWINSNTDKVPWCRQLKMTSMQIRLICIERL